MDKKSLGEGKRIIYNNDGGDAYILNSKTLNLNREERIEKFLQTRTKPLLKTNVTTIFYCTGTVGLVVHNSEVASVIPHNISAWVENSEKNLETMFENRIDPLAVVVKFCKDNKLEVFWSMRMNDIHDSGDDEYGKFIFKMNKFKQTHPECLLGSDPWSTFGRRTSVDYSCKEVRDIVYRQVEEVCQKYDVDGVQLDFYRHPIFFREPACGIHATQQQLDMMTELIGKIKKMMERESKRKKRPLLLAVRVPDSVEYCRVIGLDIEKWLKNKYIDLLIVGGYTQFNPWEYSVNLGHKYKTKVYIDLSESRIRDKGIRNTKESYRARAYNAWDSGADGIHIFNFFDLKEDNLNLLNEISDPAKLSRLDKIYFVNVLGTKIAWVNFPVNGYINISTLNPEKPAEIKIATNEIFKFMIADDFSKHKNKPLCRLKIYVNNFQDIQRKLKENFVIFYMNDYKLENAEKVYNETLPVSKEELAVIEFEVPAGVVKHGLNQIEVINRMEIENPIKLFDMQFFIRY